MPIKLNKQQSDSIIAFQLFKELEKIRRNAISKLEESIYNRDDTLTNDFRCLIGSRVLHEVLPMSHSISDDYLNQLTAIEGIIKDVRKSAEKQKTNNKTHRDI